MFHFLQTFPRQYPSSFHPFIFSQTFQVFHHCSFNYDCTIETRFCKHVTQHDLLRVMTIFYKWCLMLFTELPFSILLTTLVGSPQKEKNTICDYLKETIKLRVSTAGKSCYKKMKRPVYVLN